MKNIILFFFTLWVLVDVNKQSILMQFKSKKECLLYEKIPVTKCYRLNDN